jgi:5-methylcytosine-specific restriction endonuclease McrA|nr:MAG TPA: Recombination endonuclease VII [Caudoviricetes sp.]
MDCIEIINKFKHQRVFSTEESSLYNKALHEYHVNLVMKKEKGLKFQSLKERGLLKKCNGKCAYCGKQLTLEASDTCVDHVIPIAKGGNNEDKNLVMACRRCNSSKGAKLLSEWKGMVRNENKETISEGLYNS